MSKTSKIITAAILVAVLLLGIGYAAIQSVTLNIAGTAAADPNQENFKVMFTGTPEVSDEEHVTASITDDINATINVSGLTKKGEIVSATYTVQNASTDLSADLSVATTNSNTEYFTLSSKLAKTSLIAGEATTVTVTVEVTKTPLAASVSSTIGVQLTATPVQPGEEGTSGATNDYSQTPELPTLALVTNANIGDYIDLGNNVIGSESTSDDWRILYKDGNTVYAILADYLPASQVPAVSVGLNTDVTEYPYSVWSYTERDILLNGLKNTIVWSPFANGIRGARVTGSPTAELLRSSYNAINGTEYEGGIFLNRESRCYDLYVPHREVVGGCYGYWLASPNVGYSDYLWYVDCDGYVDTYYYYYNGTDMGVRPVVSLPSDIPVELVDDVWVVQEEGKNYIDESTLAKVTNDNIGDYIDLGNNVVGTESTADDWRILYKEGNTVYAILADYLPASQVPPTLNTNESEYPYNVWSYDTRDTLINELKDVWAWRSLANGIAGATITGAPTAELLMNSYNTKNGTELVHTEFLRLDSETEEYNLYVPHREVVSGCYGYWLASPREGYYIDDADAICWYDTVWGVSCNGVIVDIECYSNNGLGVRPVVSLLSAIQAELVDGVWVLE